MRRRGLASLFCTIALAGVLAAPGAGHAAAPLSVGVAATDLTWHVGQNRLGDVTKRIPDIAGQDVPDDPFVLAGLHTRPHAKAIVVESEQGEPFAFVRADILMVTGDLYEAVSQRVQAETGISPENLLVAATHTHVANNGLFPHVVHSVVYRSFDPREQVYLADQIAAAVKQASQNLRPATLGVGGGTVAIPAENRRHTAAESNGESPTANDPARLDTELGILRFDDAGSGKPIAVVMDYGVHPVVLINNPLVSADFVAWAERNVEKDLTDPETGDKPMAIWFTGAQGDQDALYVRYSYPEAEWTGRIFAAEAVRVAKTLTPEPLTKAQMQQKLIPLPPPGGQKTPSSEIFGPRLPIDGPSPLLIPSSVRLTAIALETQSQKTVLISWPGEPIRDIGVALKQGAHALGFDHAFILGLANDWAGYWLTPDEFDRGLYERTLMFYGRTSALYVEDNSLDLVRSLATGLSPTQVPLPPKAVADRALTAAIARAAYTLDPAVRAAVLAAPELSAPTATTQPAEITRPGVTAFTWHGGSPDVASGWIPSVVVQRKDVDTDTWRTVASEGTGEILLTNRAPLPGSYDWAATWEALPDTAVGTYRFHVEGQRATPGGQEPFALTSEEFHVNACVCLAAGMLGTTAEAGGIRISVPATYGPVTPLPVPHLEAGGFRLQPLAVTTGSATVDVFQGTQLIDTLTLSFVSDVEPVARTVTVHDISGHDLPVTISEPTELGTFQAVWTGAADVTFRLASLIDGAGNSN
jgi:neutral/alkaline ceramidase-like enzyme